MIDYPVDPSKLKPGFVVMKTMLDFHPDIEYFNKVLCHGGKYIAPMEYVEIQ